MNVLEVDSIINSLQIFELQNIHIFKENDKIVVEGRTDKYNNYFAFIKDAIDENGLIPWIKIPVDIPLIFRTFKINVNDLYGDVKFTESLCKRGKNIMFEKCILGFQ